MMGEAGSQPDGALPSARWGRHKYCGVLDDIAGDHSGLMRQAGQLGCHQFDVAGRVFGNLAS